VSPRQCSAFSASARVPVERYRVLSDTSTIKEYQSSPGVWKAFCTRCGSPAYSRVERDAGHIRLRLGTLPREAEAVVTAHVWVGSKAAWDQLGPNLPCFVRGVDSPMVDDSEADQNGRQEVQHGDGRKCV
jgi:hypothetical protein